MILEKFIKINWNEFSNWEKLGLLPTMRQPFFFALQLNEKLIISPAPVAFWSLTFALHTLFYLLFVLDLSFHRFSFFFKCSHHWSTVYTLHRCSLRLAYYVNFCNRNRYFTPLIGKGLWILTKQNESHYKTW